MKKILAAALLSFSLLPSCANTSGADYAVNRLNDLGDILRVNVKAGAGIGIQYEWTRMVGIGVLYEYKTWAAGWSNREMAYWNQSIFYWGLIVQHYSETILSGIDRNSGSYGWQFGKGGGNVMELNDPDNPLDMINVRLNAMLGIGFDIDVRIGEALDFLVGLAQFDPAHDDRDYSEMRRLEEEAAEAEAAPSP
jgi:hypothetical protein